MLKEVEERMLQEIINTRRSILKKLKLLLCSSLLFCVACLSLLILELAHGDYFSGVLNIVFFFISAGLFKRVWDVI